MTGALIAREVRRALAGGIWLPVIFFLLVATLVPFATGPDAALLGAVGPGMIWVAALLAALLPLDRLIAPDMEDGSIDQLRLRGISTEWIALTKLIGHWLGFGPLLLVALLPAAALMGLTETQIPALALSLLVGTPALAGLGIAVAGLVAGLERAGSLAGILLLPLGIPVLVFGVGAAQGQAGAFPLLGAVSLLLTVGSPFVAGAALRQRS
ncbi:heme exporter protein CcmB [Sphingomicrobium sediminis]|uniref:Heme exporter protein B n=1 Tax=Sphingomicrobium sediminis TaxID=2950949 RepID=A0A9X2J2H3_9SPHN|nr:heme exporter protein CcmB [Sphingomicrobium sediminis]